MSESALGAALYFDTELAADPAPFGTLVEALGALELRQFRVPITPSKASPPSVLHLSRFLRTIAAGKAFSAAVETPSRTAAESEIWISATTAPTIAGVRASQTACRHELDAHVGALALRELGAARFVDALIAFADAVGVRAGVILWAEPTIFAACLASCGGSSRLSVDQDRRVRDLLDTRSSWGDRVRGPAWGTFLGVAHVASLGGLSRIEREAPCSRIVGLRSGGAFLQATPIETPIVEGVADGALSELARYLQPVS